MFLLSLYMDPINKKQIMYDPSNYVLFLHKIINYWIPQSSWKVKYTGLKLRITFIHVTTKNYF